MVRLATEVRQNNPDEVILLLTESQLCQAAKRNSRDVDIFQTELKGVQPQEWEAVGSMPNLGHTLDLRSGITQRLRVAAAAHHNDI